MGNDKEKDAPRKAQKQQNGYPFSKRGKKLAKR